jgi:hypothetical protein
MRWSNAFVRGEGVKLICGVVILFMSYSAGVGQQPVSDAATGVSRAAVEQHKGQLQYVTSNISLGFSKLYKESRDGYEVLLLRAKQRNELSFEADGEQGTLEVRAWQMLGARRGKQLWVFTSEGNEGLSLPDIGLYEATSWPCCSAMWVHEYYSLYNGQRLYTTNGAPAFQEGWSDPGLLRISSHTYKDWRFVAFGASYEKGREQPKLQYGTERARKQSFILKGHDYGDNFDVPEMQLLDGDGKKVQDLDGALTFTIILRFGEAEDPAVEVRVPVVDDVVRPDLATLPKGYSLLAEKP